MKIMKGFGINMKFKKDSMYKNLFKDKEVAFYVDEVLGQDSSGADLVVTWFKLSQDGRYVSMGIDGEFHVPKDMLFHYLEV